MIAPADLVHRDNVSHKAYLQKVRSSDELYARHKCTFIYLLHLGLFSSVFMYECIGPVLFTSSGKTQQKGEEVPLGLINIYFFMLINVRE